MISEAKYDHDIYEVHVVHRLQYFGWDSFETGDDVVSGKRRRRTTGHRRKLDHVWRRSCHRQAAGGKRIHHRNGQYFNYLSLNMTDAIFVFKVLSDFEKINIDETVSICLCVCPSQAIPRKLLKSSSNLTQWLLHTCECITYMLSILTLTFKVTQTLY